MPKRIDPSLIPLFPDLSLEQGLWDAGIEHIGGVDEAGRGALAGPVTAALVIFPKKSASSPLLNQVRDSKQLSPKRREYLAPLIKQHAVTWGVEHISPEVIDEIGIVPSIRLAVMRLLSKLITQPEHLLLDYLLLSESKIPQTSLMKGDQRSLSIAAASIIAKTERDRLLRSYKIEFPDYGFENNKGYGTFAHRACIIDLGSTTHHRKSFKLLPTE